MTSRLADFPVWRRALRAYSFSATVIPVTCAFLFIRMQGLPVAWPLFPLFLFCALLLHAGTNLLNDYYDFTLGFDTAEARGSSGLLQEKAVPPAYLLRRGRFYLLAAATAGLLLTAARGLPLLIPGTAGLAGAWFYSHPHGYKYKGLGEPFVFLLMGPLLFFAAAFAASGVFLYSAAWPAIACGGWVTAILLVNNLRDIQMDSAAGFTTLPMRLGPSAAKKMYAALLCTAFTMPLVLFSTGTAGAGILLPLLSLPAAWKQVKAVHKAEILSPELASAPQKTAALYLLFGVLLAAGLLFM